MGWKDVEFSGSDSAERVRRLQALCTDAVDGLLFIGGVDSFHAPLAQAVLKYLFLGSSGQELLGEQVISQAYDRLEDVVLLLTHDRISIFYSSESDAAITILPMIAQWRHVTEYTIHDGMDPDEQETHKIQAFQRMVQSIRRIGIPYGVDKHGNDLHDPMIPEKWPLVQSYGLENGAPAKGFFTMNHTVVNVTSLLRDELAKLDDFSAKRVAIQVPPMLAHHYDQFLHKLDHPESPAVRNGKSESDVAEDLVSFYEFGTTQHETRGLVIADHRGSRVLFGTRTVDASRLRSSPSAYLHNSGGSTGPATHMLVQSEDPFSGVRFTRTYFLATGKTAPHIVDEDALVHHDEELTAKRSEDKSNTSNNTRRLIELYVVLLRGFRRAVRTFVEKAKCGTLAECLVAAKTEALKGICTVTKADIWEQNLRVEAENLDACGRDSRFPGHKWNLVYLSFALEHVPSEINPSETLGSLVVGDTLLFRTSSSPGGSCLNTTSSFSYFRSWIQSGREADSVRAQLAVLQSGFMLQTPALRLGQPMTPLDAALDDVIARPASDPASSIAPSNATPTVSSIGLARAILLLECEELPQLRGTMQLFTGGFCFKTPHLIPILLSFANDVASFCIMATPDEELVLLQLELKANDHNDTAISRVLPFPTVSRILALPLLAGTRFQEEIVHALSVWKATAERLAIPFYRPHDLMQFDGTTPRDDHMSNGAQELSPRMAASCATLVRKASSSAMTDTTTVDELFPRWFIPKDANPTTTLPKPRKLDRAKTVVPLTIVLGLPGSSATTIASTICDVSSATTDWTRVHVDCRDGTDGDHDKFAAAQINQRVGAALDRVLADTATSELPTRLLLCVIGYVDVVAVVVAVKQGASRWPLPTKIASVIGCVSATNAYLPDANNAQCPLPRLLDQLTSGFTTHVVVTHTSDVASSALGRLRYHIDQTNPFADIHVLSSDVFEGSMTPLLCIDRFESAYYKAYREAQFPGWETLSSGPMDPAMMPENVHFEIAPGMEKARFLQAVGHTLTPHAIMTKSMDKIHPMDPQLMARQPPTKGSSGIRLAQTLAAEKILAQQRQQLADEQNLYGECWSVEALVSFAGNVDTIYEYISTGTYARMRVVNQATSLSTSLEIKITGRQLHPTKIQELILGCYVTLDGAVRPLKNRVTLEEKREIQKLHIMDELPEGFYYDGVTYIDQFGGRHEFHPRMHEFIEEYLRAQNEKTTQHNAHVEENRRAQTMYVRQLT